MPATSGNRAADRSGLDNEIKHDGFRIMAAASSNAFA